MDSEIKETLSDNVSHLKAPENNRDVDYPSLNNDISENDVDVHQEIEENNSTHSLNSIENNDFSHGYYRPNSLRLESVLEYTSKIKTFLGLEEESVTAEGNGELSERPTSNNNTEPILDIPKTTLEKNPNISGVVSKQDPTIPIITKEEDYNSTDHVADDEQCVTDLKLKELPDILETSLDLVKNISEANPDLISENGDLIVSKTEENIEGHLLHSNTLNENLKENLNYDVGVISNDTLNSLTPEKENNDLNQENVPSNPESTLAQNFEVLKAKNEDAAEESDGWTTLSESKCQQVNDEKENDLEQLECPAEGSVGEEVSLNNEPDCNSSELLSLKGKAETQAESAIRDKLSENEDGKTIHLNGELKDDQTKEKPYQIMDIVEGLKAVEKGSNLINNNTIMGILDEKNVAKNLHVISALPDSNDDSNVPNMDDLRRLSTEVVASVLQSAGDQMKVILDEGTSNETSKDAVGVVPENILSNVSVTEDKIESESLKGNIDSVLDGNIPTNRDVMCVQHEIIPDFSTTNTQCQERIDNKSNEFGTAITKQRDIPLKTLSASVESIVICNVVSTCDTDPNTQCGIGAFKPQCIQQFATARMYLVLYSILGILHGSYYTYLVGVLSTLEKRFEFKSKTSGTIMMLDELTPLFLGVLIGHFGGRAHRPRLLSFGMFLSAFCCFASALPYFLYGPATHLSSTSFNNVTGPEMCDGKARMDYCDSDDRPPTMTAILLLMLGSFLKGFGNLAYYAIGLAYLDDNAKKKNSPLYFAVAFALRLLGPMVGYLMSSYFLKFYESPFDDPGFGPDDPRWVGGWWMGFMLQGILLLIFAGPIALFPRRLPGHMSAIQEMEQNAKPFFEGLGDALKRLAKNPLFVLITLNAVLTIYGNFGYYIMVPKYMENQFRFSASTASLFAGPPGIAAVMLSTILGGYLIWKFKPSAKFLSAALVTVEVISTTGYLLLMIPQCETTDLANFGFGEESLILEGTCNTNCSCSTVSFNPICGPDGKTTFFSPCYAGCSYQEEQSYFNCSCAGNYGENAVATKGFCSVDCWTKALTYIIMLPIFQFTCNTVRVAFTIILLRSIKPEDKSIALGVFETMVSTLAFIPFPILYGALVDSSCLVWEKSCEESGNCWFYDMKRFNYLLHGTSATFCGLAVFCLSGIFCCIDKIHDLYDDFDEKPKEVELSAMETNKDANVVIKI